MSAPKKSCVDKLLESKINVILDATFSNKHIADFVADYRLTKNILAYFAVVGCVACLGVVCSNYWLKEQVDANAIASTNQIAHLGDKLKSTNCIVLEIDDETIIITKNGEKLEIDAENASNLESVLEHRVDTHGFYKTLRKVNCSILSPTKVLSLLFTAVDSEAEFIGVFRTGTMKYLDFEKVVRKITTDQMLIGDCKIFLVYCENGEYFMKGSDFKSLKQSHQDRVDSYAPPDDGQNHDEDAYGIEYANLFDDWAVSTDILLAYDKDGTLTELQYFNNANFKKILIKDLTSGELKRKIGKQEVMIH